jgi:hypothetical protein
MDLEQINSRLIEIKLEIGTVRYRRNCSAISGVSFALAGTLRAVRVVMDINNPSNSISSSPVTLALIAILNGISWYVYQRDLTNLKKEQEKLELEEDIQKILAR